MPFTTKMQSLVGTHSNVFPSGIDWARNRVYEPGGAWLSRYGLISGLEEEFVSTGAISMPSGSPVNVDSDGNVIGDGGASAAFNGGTQLLDPTLTRIATAAYSGGHYGGGDYASVLVGTQQYHIGCGTGAPVGGTHAIMICQDVTQIYAESWPAGANGGALCSGASGSNVVYLFTGPTLGQGGTQAVTITEYTCSPSVSKRIVVTFTPTDIDAAWTGIYFGDACLDQTDNNLMLFLGGQNGAAVLNYLIKIDPSDGSILWQVTVNSSSRRTGGLMSRSRITHGQFGYVSTDSPKTITIVNTSDGSTVSTQTTGLNGVALPEATGAYNDTLGCIASWYDYLYVDADSPVRLNGTPSSFNGAGVLYVASPPIPAVNTTGSYTRIWGNYH